MSDPEPFWHKAEAILPAQTIDVGRLDHLGEACVVLTFNRGTSWERSVALSFSHCSELARQLIEMAAEKAAEGNAKPN